MCPYRRAAIAISFNTMMELFFLSLYKIVAYAAIGWGLFITMSGRAEILGFIPAYIEDRFGPHSKVYRLVTCPKCLAAWSALIIGFPNFTRHGLEFYAFTVAGAMLAALLLEKYAR